MSKKSIRFIARDLGRSYDYVKRNIEEMGIEPDDYSDMGTPTYSEDTQKDIQVYMNVGISWYCDNCGTYMNDQKGFNTHSGSWTCEKCGFINDVTKDNLR